MRNILLIFAVLLCSCYNQKKAQRDLSKAVVTYPKLGSDYCAFYFPTKDSIIKGDSIITFDTIYINPNVDTIIYEGGDDKIDTTFIKVNSPPKIKLITKTIHVIDTVYQENKAALRSCELDKSAAISSLNEEQKRANKYQAQAKKRGLIMWGTFGLLFLILAGYFYIRFKTKK